MKREEWRPVTGYVGRYEVSDRGRVRNPQGRLLTPETGTWGHKRVGLRGPGGRDRHHFVHRLVLEAFVGPAPADGPLALHADDDPANNHLGNLRWGSQSDNQKDSVRNGGHFQAKKTACPRGHDYTPENTRVTPSGHRRCRECHRQSRRRARQAVA